MRELGLEFLNKRNEFLASQNVRILMENQFKSWKSALVERFGGILNECKQRLQRKEETILSLSILRFFRDQTNIQKRLQNWQQDQT